MEEAQHGLVVDGGDADNVGSCGKAAHLNVSVTWQAGENTLACIVVEGNADDFFFVYRHVDATLGTVVDNFLLRIDRLCDVVHFVVLGDNLNAVSIDGIMNILDFVDNLGGLKDGDIGSGVVDGNGARIVAITIRPPLEAETGVANNG